MPTFIDALASVYARSLFELALAAGGGAKTSEVAGELEEIVELTRSNRAFREFIASPVIDQARREHSLRRIFQNRVTDLTLRFLLVLNGKQRLSRLESVAAAFDALVQEAFGRVEVDVFTAAPLGGRQVTEIAGRIQAALNREPVVHAYTEPSMIGGIKLRVGDRLIDGSVATQLRRMRRQLEQSTGKLRDRANRFLSD